MKQQKICTPFALTNRINQSRWKKECPFEDILLHKHNIYKDLKINANKSLVTEAYTIEKEFSYLAKASFTKDF